jgi:hypothetical protein
MLLMMLWLVMLKVVVLSRCVKVIEISMVIALLSSSSQRGGM